MSSSSPDLDFSPPISSQRKAVQLSAASVSTGGGIGALAQDLFFSLLTPLLSSDLRVSLECSRRGKARASNSSLTDVKQVRGRRGGKGISENAGAVWGGVPSLDVGF